MTARHDPTAAPRGFSQREAARYLGVSVRWFRQHVHIEPVPVGAGRTGAAPSGTGRHGGTRRLVPSVVPSNSFALQKKGGA